MSVVVGSHPPKAVLTAFSTGSLQEPSASEVASHLISCDACTQTLLELQSEDTLLELLKKRAVPEECASTCSLQQSDRESTDINLIGTHPRYELIELIGRGGMGDVFRARHRLMDREVAIKLLNAPTWRRELQRREAVLRFQREVKAAAKISHPNIVAAFDAEEFEGLHFLVMEYIEGQDLSTYVKQNGPLPIDEATECLRQACLGLEVAHQHGLVHRDVKPHNLMFSRDDLGRPHVKVLDFGIASLVISPNSDSDSAPVSGLTHAGRVIGTPEFMSPEQARDSSCVDCRSDVYSLGATFHFLLTGRPPFEGTTSELLEKHMHASPPECETLAGNDDLADVLARMLAKSSEDRFQSVEELRIALEQTQASTPTVQPTQPFPFYKATIMSAVFAFASCVLATLAIWPADEGSANKSTTASSAVDPTATPTEFAKPKPAGVGAAAVAPGVTDTGDDAALQYVRSVMPPDQYLYFSVFMKDMEFEEADGEEVRSHLRNIFGRHRFDGYWLWGQIKLDDDVEVYMDRRVAFRPDSRMTIVARIPKAKDVNGVIHCPAVDGKSMKQYRFTIPKESWRSDESTSRSFFRIMASDYQWLAGKDLAGSSWFRARANYALRVLREVHKQKDLPSGTGIPPRWTSYERSFDLFTGSTAVAENLQLDRALRRASQENAVVPVESIPGITVTGYDWSELTREIDPKLDPLSQFIPHDQHAFFFSNFASLVQTVGRVQSDAATLMQLMQLEGNGSDLFARYQDELGLSMNDLAKLLGPKLIDSVAVTGSDPYFDLGTDVAVLLEPKQPQALLQLLEAQIMLSASKRNSPVTKMKGKVEGIAYQHFSSEDGKLHSYLYAANGYVAVTNSLGQINRLAKVLRDDATAKLSLGEEPEYRYFRDLYPINKKNNRKGLLVISDATIRRWCGPRMRIANSRRLHARGALGALQAENYHQSILVEPKQHPSVNLQRYRSLLGEVGIKKHRVHSETFGSTGDLTPLIDLPITHVSQEEKVSYSTWRDSYQRRWRGAFDPIALHFELDRALDFDLTVMPLIAGTQYSFVRNLMVPAKIDSILADSHEGTVLHMAASLNEFAVRMLIGATIEEWQQEPLEWIGQTASIYIDWDETLAEPLTDIEDLENLPLGITLAIQEGKDEDKLLEFFRKLTTVFDTKQGEWKDSRYKKTRILTYAREDVYWDGELHLTVVGRVLLASPNLGVVHRAIDRQFAGPQEAFRKEDTANWLGDHINMKFNKQFIDLLEASTSQQFSRELNTSTWGNIPILNEWKKHFKELDPGEVHNHLWSQELIAVDGSGYEWDDAAKTMVSSHFGRPGSNVQLGRSLPSAYRDIQSAAAGVTFVNDGIRARVRIERDQ